MPNNRSAPSPLRTESYDSVSVTWLDRVGARESAETAARDLAGAHPDVSGILLFGSLERGDAVPGSDVDFLVVLRTSALSFLERIPRFTPLVPGLAVDALPYTERELAELRASDHPLVRTALAEGRWIVGPPPALRD